MKKLFLGVAAVAAMMFVACDSDSGTSANGREEKSSLSSAEVNSSSSSALSSSATTEDLASSSSSSSVSMTSSSVIPDTDPESSSSSVVTRGDGSSSSVNIVSSSSVALSSSSSVEYSSSAISVAGSEYAWTYLSPNFTYGEFVDERDGQKYKTVQIGEQIWMAQNLNLQYSSDVNSDVNNDPPNSVCYKNSQDSCAKYGRMYNWAAALEVCPEGWHLPSDAEWGVLIDAVGGTSVAGRELKSDNGDLWYSAGKGNNSVGFNAIPGGIKECINCKFNYSGMETGFWSTKPEAINKALEYDLTYDDYAVVKVLASKSSFFSVRCIKDGFTGVSSSSFEVQSTYPGETALDYLNSSVSYGEFTDARDGKTYKTVEIGSQTWMAQNLNYSDSTLTAMLPGEMWCNENVLDSCAKNGRLYTWYAARNVCPSGWHLPEKVEWDTLLTFVGGAETAADSLKAEKGWVVGGTIVEDGYAWWSNSFGFTVMPAGYRTYTGEFEYGTMESYQDTLALTSKTYFWSSTPYNSNVSTTGIYTYGFGVYADVSVTLEFRNSGYYVRCVKD